jgi:trimethylamine--corrinoid protein Co-methyltransferase
MAKCLAKIISDDEVERIRKESIKILADVGVKVSHQKAKKMLEAAGAKVDHETDLVVIPAELTEDCLKKLPQKLILAGRNPEKDAVIERGIARKYLRTLSGCEMCVDLHNGKYRKIALSDVKDWAVLVDGLENVSLCTAPYYSGQGLNPKARDVRAFEILLENTTKHILIAPYGPQNVEFCLQLAIAEAGSEEILRKRPRFSIHVAPVSPLHYHGNTVEMMLMAAEYMLPVSQGNMPLCGVSGPVTLAGGVLLSVAEHLAAVVILELANPGAPLILAATPGPVDMSTGLVMTGSIESSVMAVALAQVAKEGFGWPIDVMGAASESFLPDAQCIIEHSCAMILNSCSGADILAGAGHFETGLTLDPALLVIDNEIYGMMLKGSKGIEVNDDTLGIEAIRRIGAGAGKSYLADEHTLRHFRDAYYRPTILTRSSRESWEGSGKKNLYEKARERAIKILEEHKPTLLKESVVKELRAIAERAEREIKEMTTV